MCVLVLLLLALPAAAQTIYVSSSTGNDGNDGLSPATAIRTIGQVNSLDLPAGAQVLFKCGDVWRTEMLRIVNSGTEANPIRFSSYPEGCENKPVFSGAQPVSGWTLYSGSIYVADLSAGDNAGLFALGVNQLFQDGVRLPFGRWPNVDANASGGYSFVDGQSGARDIMDNELPAADWSGAVVHIKTIRWLLLNREVTGSSGTTLTLSEDIECWGGSCAGWGYFLNNHLATLDSEGEWFYDEAAHKVYVYSSSGTPQNIEGSVVLNEDPDNSGAIILGHHLWEHISYVSVDNFGVRHWFSNGITTPVNWETDDNSFVILRNNRIIDVEAVGIRLAAWVWNAANGVDGWRGGHDLVVSGNVIDGANYFGIHTYSYHSLYADNVVKNIGLIKNLGKGGLGCGYAGSNCTENGDGIRVKLDKVAYSSHGNTLRGNRLERIGYCGFDIFGPDNVLERNVIKEACFTKGDCGGVRTFGRTSLAATDVHDVTIQDNIILDTIGNTDGDSETFKPLFGMGLYIDNYSKNVDVINNTIINSTVDGILFQRSTGRIMGNTLYNNNSGTMYRGQIGIYGSESVISELTNNILFALNDISYTLILSGLNNLTFSDYNRFDHPYKTNHISVNGTKTLAAWQTYSNMDSHSQTLWYMLNPEDPPKSGVFYNDTSNVQTILLGATRYLDLNQNPVVGKLFLDPYDSKILISAGSGGIPLVWVFQLLLGSQ